MGDSKTNVKSNHTIPMFLCLLRVSNVASVPMCSDGKGEVCHIPFWERIRYPPFLGGHT